MFTAETAGGTKIMPTPFFKIGENVPEQTCPIFSPESLITSLPSLKIPLFFTAKPTLFLETPS